MRIVPLLLTSLWTTFVVAQNSGLHIHTQQGDVLGSLITPTVRQFLGIPYAVADRWEAPELPPQRQNVFTADHFSDSCFQLNSTSATGFSALLGTVVPNITESENCLSVNIWSPSVNRTQKTAVMLWIHGGAFQLGASNLPTYDGHFFVRDNDVTLVTFNYRLNVFGQPNAPQLLTSTTGQNFGLLDIDAAVQWVHDNIANFGGDPERIILFGESAGSVAADLYTIAHPSDDRIKGVIEQSGSVSGGDTIGLTRSFVNSTLWNELANAVGCGPNPDDAQLACMKQVPGRTLEDAVVNDSFFWLVADNTTVFSDIATRVASGSFLKVPLLVGNNKHEQDIFVVSAQLLSPLGFAQPLWTELASDLLTYTTFTCPSGEAVLARRNASIPAWRYQYEAVFRDISTRPDLRAYHGSELSIVFGTYNQTTDVAQTPEEIALSRYIQSAWVAFARDPQKGLSDFGWPLYDSTNDSLIQLGGFFNTSGTAFGRGDQLDFVCSKADALAAVSAQVLDLI